MEAEGGLGRGRTAVEEGDGEGAAGGGDEGDFAEGGGEGGEEFLSVLFLGREEVR